MNVRGLGPTVLTVLAFSVAAIALPRLVHAQAPTAVHDSTAEAAARASQRPQSWSEIAAIMDAADTVRVVRMHPRVVTMPRDAHPDSTWRPGGRDQRTVAGRDWGHGFAIAMANGGRFDSLHICEPSCWPCDSTQQLVVWVTFGSLRRFDGFLLRFRERCIEVIGPRGPAGSIAMGAAAPALFALVRQALPRDSVLAALRMPVGVWPDSTRPRLLTPTSGGGVEVIPTAIHTEKPEYPLAARKAGVSGTVFVQALIGRDGAVEQAFVKDSVPMLDEPALACVKKWTFKPATSGGQPVAVWVAIPVKFTLHD